MSRALNNFSDTINGVPVEFNNLQNNEILKYNATLGIFENAVDSAPAVDTIYTADGVLAGNRTVTMGANSLQATGANGTLLSMVPATQTAILQATNTDIGSNTGTLRFPGVTDSGSGNIVTVNGTGVVGTTNNPTITKLDVGDDTNTDQDLIEMKTGLGVNNYKMKYKTDLFGVPDLEALLFEMPSPGGIGLPLPQANMFLVGANSCLYGAFGNDLSNGVAQFGWGVIQDPTTLINSKRCSWSYSAATNNINLVYAYSLSGDSEIMQFTANPTASSVDSAILATSNITGNVEINNGSNVIFGNSGNIQANARITNVTTPVSGQDAANKDYVDGQASQFGQLLFNGPRTGLNSSLARFSQFFDVTYPDQTLNLRIYVDNNFTDDRFTGTFDIVLVRNATAGAYYNVPPVNKDNENPNVGFLVRTTSDTTCEIWGYLIGTEVNTVTPDMRVYNHAFNNVTLVASSFNIQSSLPIAQDLHIDAFNIYQQDGVVQENRTVDLDSNTLNFNNNNTFTVTGGLVDFTNNFRLSNLAGGGTRTLQVDNLGDVQAVAPVVDTNFAINNLTFTGDRQHNLAGNTLFLENCEVLQIRKNSSPTVKEDLRLERFGGTDLGGVAYCDELGNYITYFQQQAGGVLPDQNDFIFRARGFNADPELIGENLRLQNGGTTSVKISNGELDMSTAKIINVVDPTALQDVATKNYVDTEIGNEVFYATDGTLTGNRVVSGGGNTLRFALDEMSVKGNTSSGTNLNVGDGTAADIPINMCNGANNSFGYGTVPTRIQETFSFQGAANERHAIRSVHNGVSGTAFTNRIQFDIWSFGTDVGGTPATTTSMTISDTGIGFNKYTTGAKLAGTGPFGAATNLLATDATGKVCQVALAAGRSFSASMGGNLNALGDYAELNLRQSAAAAGSVIGSRVVIPYACNVTFISWDIATTGGTMAIIQNGLVADTFNMATLQGVYTVSPTLSYAASDTFELRYDLLTAPGNSMFNVFFEE